MISLDKSLLAGFDRLIADRPRVDLSPSDMRDLYAVAQRFPDGCDMRLSEGEYLIDKTIRLPSNTRIMGAGSGLTRLTLAPGSNCHMFVIDGDRGARNLSFSHFSVDGCGDRQERPADSKALTFCCAIYLRGICSVIAHDLEFENIRQTAMHFNTCINVAATDIRAKRLGWSGVSTSRASNVTISAEVTDAGRDKMHSGIHVDGGTGVFVDAVVTHTTGNGIMIDSAFSALRNCVVTGVVYECRRGVSLSGSGEKALENVVISGDFSNNRDAGVMVSNSNGVAIVNSKIRNNGEHGVLFQGRNGGSRCIVHNCDVAGNGQNFGHLHESADNWIFSDVARPESASINLRTLRAREGTSREWFS